ncbi:nodulation protein NfeD [Defluviimonas sp. WL0002]|uniref:Nodulation protein NfeD n=1 Tax=Albidovulum marisflavi TaxID=2984159 RepID=A0ABT2ZB12_9RHOB|nr:nodulation protein NfeD [Defluviimonas sp. WL0002]MCV2868340.1 nodulation protein NfeD [Defluviimonas sp. WL0002]
MVATGLSIVRMLLALAIVFLGHVEAAGQQAERPDTRGIALLSDIDGPIGPATTRHVEKTIAEAYLRGASVIILRLNTPGGLADSMRDIISEILESPVPVIGHVAPPGAHAASAGTYILYATHVAAMAPGTNIGAATPVQIGGQSPGGGDQFDRGPSDTSDEAGAANDTADTDEGGATGESTPWLAPDEAMTRKATNDAVAFIRSLAELRGRNADWAESAVREAASLSSARALDLGVIDLVASDTDELLDAVDGRTVLVRSSDVVLETRGLEVQRMEMDAITRLLGVLSNPNVSLILMMIGIYGLIFEFWNPGSIGPGVIGAISLTLGLYALNLLPLDYAGLALIGLGVAFMVTEAFTPTFGVLGFGGLAAFVVGSAMLVDTDVPAYQISWWLIGTLAAISGAFLTLVLGYTVRIYRRRAVPADGRLVGSIAQVLDWSGRTGHVWAEGERWNATAQTEIAPGAAVEIQAIEGLTLIVRPGAATQPRGGGRNLREGKD